MLSAIAGLVPAAPLVAQPAPPATAPSAPPPAATAPAAPEQPFDPAARATAVVEQDVRTLATGRTQPERDEAARRLLVTAGARERLRTALNQITNPGAQLAAARALADDPNPDPQLID